MRCFYLIIVTVSLFLFFFFFNDTATTEIYTLSLHDALPISKPGATLARMTRAILAVLVFLPPASAFAQQVDRKSTRLNSSHSQISYAVFCLKKKKKKNTSEPKNRTCRRVSSLIYGSSTNRAM